MSRVKKKIKEYSYDDCWMYILLLTTLVIFMEALKSYTFKIDGVNLTYSLLLMPLMYFIVNFITKKYDYKKSIAAIAISGVIFVCFIALMSFTLGEKLMLGNISGEFCAYIVSQFINLTLYLFLIDNTDSPFILIILNYMFAFIVYYLFYTLIYLNAINLDSYWTGYFITLGIQFIICIPIVYFDIRIKRRGK